MLIASPALNREEVNESSTTSGIGPMSARQRFTISSPLMFRVSEGDSPSTTSPMWEERAAPIMLPAFCCARAAFGCSPMAAMMFRMTSESLPGSLRVISSPTCLCSKTALSSMSAIYRSVTSAGVPSARVRCAETYSFSTVGKNTKRRTPPATSPVVRMIAPTPMDRVRYRQERAFFNRGT